MFSRQITNDRRIDELLDHLKTGDRLTVAELSRLDRTLAQIVFTIDALAARGIGFHFGKEGKHLNGKRDMIAKGKLAMVALMAEIERDLISERTKAGLEAAKAKGKKLGMPLGGTGKSKLDGKENE